MFIGHFGLSFAAKKAVPQVSLVTLFIATQFVDLLWPFLLVFNIEKVAVVPGYTKTNSFEFLYYPITHSLMMGIVWGMIAGLLYWGFKRDYKAAVVIGLCVLSHWFLDLIVHTADLPLTLFGDVKVGFGLWNHVALTLIIESVLFFGGAMLYAGVTVAKNKKGTWLLWTLVVLLFVISLGNTFGPPPSASIMGLFVSFMALMLIILLLAFWTDRNRVIKS